MSLTPYQIQDRLLQVMKADGTVRNLHVALEIITMLENITITRQELEDTRIGKHINLVRKAAKDPGLQKRAKKLIKTWQQMLPVSMQQQQQSKKKISPDKPPRNSPAPPPPPQQQHRQQTKHRTASPAVKSAERRHNNNNSSSSSAPTKPPAVATTTNHRSTVNGDLRDRDRERGHKRKADAKSPAPRDKLKTDAKFRRSAHYPSSAHRNTSSPSPSSAVGVNSATPTNSSSPRLPAKHSAALDSPKPSKTRSPKSSKNSKSGSRSHATSASLHTPNHGSPAAANLKCETNGLKIKFLTMPSTSPQKDEYTTNAWQEHEPKASHKRKRDDDISPPDSLDSTRTNDESASSSLYSTFNPSPPLSNSAPYLSEPFHDHRSPPLATVNLTSSNSVAVAPPGAKHVSETQPRGGTVNVTVTDSARAARCQKPAFNIPDNPDEKSGVDGCRGGQGAWYAWSDSIFLRRPTVLAVNDAAAAAAEIEPLAILPYVELD